MSYIASDGVTIATSTSIDAYRSVSGRSTIEIALPAGGSHTSATVLAIGGTDWKAVGAVDGAVSITPNHDIVKLQSSALQNPYAVIDTAYDWQVTFTLQEVDLHNWAHALGYNQASVDTQDYEPGGGSTDPVDQSELTFKAGQNAAYRAMRIVTASAGSAAAVPGSSTAHQAIVFFKVRFQASGSFDFDRTAAQSIPVTAHCLGNSSDECGALLTGVAIGTRTYG